MTGCLIQTIKRHTLLTVERETRLEGAPPESKMRMDIECSQGKGEGKDIMADYATVGPHGQSLRAEAATKKLSAAGKKEKVKENKYKRYMKQSQEFFPLIMEVTGGVGNRFNDFLKRIKEEMES